MARAGLASVPDAEAPRHCSEWPWSHSRIHLLIKDQLTEAPSFGRSDENRFGLWYFLDFLDDLKDREVVPHPI